MKNTKRTRDSMMQDLDVSSRFVWDALERARGLLDNPSAYLRSGDAYNVGRDTSISVPGTALVEKSVSVLLDAGARASVRGRVRGERRHLARLAAAEKPFSAAC
jgi:hypothetical protein